MSSIDNLKEIHEAGEFEVNGRTYRFTQMSFKDAKRVFAYFTEIANDIEQGRMGFIDTKRFEEIEKVLWSHVMYDDMQVSKMPQHWGAHTSDYMPLVSVALGVFSVPFLPDSDTSSQSMSTGKAKTISRKPM